jgi:hypothetical protein
LGAVIRLKSTIPAGEIIAEYPGPARWASSEEYDHISRTSDYAFGIGPFNLSGVTCWIIWDGAHVSQEYDERYVGHLFNTSHPREFDHDLRFPNCTFGIYFCEDFVVNRTILPNVRLFIVAMNKLEHVRGPKIELVVDYHWVLCRKFGLFCGDICCKLCFDELRSFMVWWSAYMRNMTRTAAI